MTSFRQIDREIKKLIFLRFQHAPRLSSNHFRQKHEISRVARRRAKLKHQKSIYLLKSRGKSSLCKKKGK